jgi:hypothetical protein
MEYSTQIIGHLLKCITASVTLVKRKSVGGTEW